MNQRIICEDLLTDSFLLSAEDHIQMHDTPHYKARIVIISITRGWLQMLDARYMLDILNVSSPTYLFNQEKEQLRTKIKT